MDTFPELQRLTINKNVLGKNRRIKEIKYLKYPPKELVKKYGTDVVNVRIFMISGSLAINKLLAENGLSGLVTEVIGKPFDVQYLLQKLKDIL